MRRPAFSLALAFAGGIIASRALAVESITGAGILSLLAAFAGAIIHGRGASTLASIAAVLLAGVCAYSYRQTAIESTDLRRLFSDRPARVAIRGIVLQTPSIRETDMADSFGYKGTSLLEVREIELPEGWRPAKGRVRLVSLTEEPPDCKCGDLIQASGTLRRIPQATNPGQFDRRAFWRRRGINYSFLVKGQSRIRMVRRAGGPGLRRLFDGIRQRLRHGLEMGVPDCAERRIMTAMVLGCRDNVDDEIILPFRNTNTLHILAISGLHVGFVYLAIRLAMRAFRLSPRCGSLIAAPLICAYAAVTGLRVPVIRASVMLICFLSAPLFGRRGDALNSLGVAACVLLLLNPLQIFDAGFQLSFAAVLSIILLARPIADLFFRLWPCSPLKGQFLVTRAERLRWMVGRKVILLVSTSIAAWAGLAPLIAKTFHVISPLGLLGNLVVIPLGFAVVLLGLSGAIVSLFVPPLAALLNTINCVIVTLMRGAVDAIGSVPYGWLYTPSPTFLQFAAYYGLLAIGGFLIARRIAGRARLLTVLTAAVIMVLPFAFSTATPRFVMTFLDVGEGDATYVEFPNGQNLLIDGGPQYGTRAGETVLEPFLRALGRSRIDAVLLTHPHLDHISGLFTVLERFRVGKVILAEWGETAEAYGRFLELARRNGIPVRAVARGDCVAAGAGARITVVNPGGRLHRGTRSDLNNNSVALLFEYGRIRVLYCADMEREAEEELCRSLISLRVDVVRTGHHGGGTSSTKEFLRRLSPRWAIISAGVNNRFGHPSPETLARLSERGVTVLRTDIHGAITLSTDGRVMDIETFR